MKTKILLVDDRRENLLALASLLEAPDTDLVLARSGAEALRNVLQHNFALILLDAQMPGMDGYEAAALIRQREASRHTPIIFLTAFSTEQDRVAQAYGLGAVDYLFKPFVPEILKAKVAVFAELARKADTIQHQAALLEERAGQLERINGELSAEVEQRKRAEEDLARQARRLRRSNAELGEANTQLENLYNRVRDLDRRKSEFFVNVSHELRTPLTLILSCALEMMGAAGGLFDEQRKAVDVLQRNAQSLLARINELLAMAKQEAGGTAIEYERTDLARLMRAAADSFSILAEQKGVALRVETPPSLDVYVDHEKMERVVGNLLSNAFKFGSSGGNIVCRLYTAEQSAVIEVEDNGPGVPAEYRDAVFDRFRQVSAEGGQPPAGTGLGLSIVKDLVESHGGAVTVSEAPGGGALFRVRLPLELPAGVLGVPQPSADPVETTAVAPAATEETGLGGKAAMPAALAGAKVLVAEDHADMRWFIEQTLSPACHVVTAGGGREALARMHEASPDIVITDLMMPDGDGEELIRQVRARREFDAIPILVLTAKPDDALRLRLLRSGAQDYLIKPFSTRELLVRAANLVSAKKLRDLLSTEVSSQEKDVVALVREVLDGREQLQRALEELNQRKDELAVYAGELEQRVRQRTAELNDKNEQLETFAYTVAHDLRAPLRAMKGFAQALVEDFEGRLGGRAERYVGEIVTAADRMNALIEDLLGYSSLDRADIQIEVTPLRFAVEEALTELAPEIKQRGAEIHLDVPDDLPAVAAHPGTLVQVLANLINNAVKFVAPGVRPVVHIGGVDAGDNVRISVRDNGIGIAPEYHDRIFGVFERLHGPRTYPGTGIGLAIVARGIARMDGRLGVESQSGTGSEFWFELAKGKAQSAATITHSSVS